MGYQSLSLGELVVKALKTATRDPKLYERVDAANARLDDLTSRVEDLKNSLTQSEALDSSQQEELDGIHKELTDLATALQGGVMEDVEDPTNTDVGGDTGTTTDTGGGDTPTDTGGDTPVVTDPTSTDTGGDVSPPVDVEVATDTTDFQNWDNEDNTDTGTNP